MKGTLKKFTEEINKIDLVEMCAYGMKKDLVCKKEKIKCSNIIKQYKNA